jgi:tetratricopeptide (TPR) repeat protein
MKRFAFMLAAILCLLLVAAASPAGAKETWTRVRSENFLLVGNAGERDMREVAARLEQFREVFARLATNANFVSPVPTTVIVFKSNVSFQFFKPLYQGSPSDVVGYFQPGRDVNYIALTTDRRSENQYGTIFHEYVHLMIDNNMRGVPSWFNEGMAEYYSTFEVADEGRKGVTGNRIAHHVRLLNTRPLLPLRTLLAADHDSPYYNESDKKSMFYAESWALVHYLIHSGTRERERQLTRYLNLLGAGTHAEDAFRQAFETSLEAVERELRAYVRDFNVPVRTVLFDKELKRERAMKSEAITEAEVQYYLGDLLLHTDRLDDAETHLKRALALDPHLALADASLGLLRARQLRLTEARQHLQRSLAKDPQSYLAHYYYAFALSREGMNEEQLVGGYAPETARSIRAALNKAIELAPGFPESYHLLGFVHLAMDERLDEAVTLLKRALALSPGRYEFTNVLAQVYLRQENFKAARQLLEPFIHGSADLRIREQARSLLGIVASLEERASRAPSFENSLKSIEAATGEPQAGDTFQPVRSVLRKRFQGERVRGRLTRIECTETGVALSVTVGDRTLNLHSSALRRIMFITYVPQVKGELTCGTRDPATTVIATYRAAHTAGTKFDGEAVAIEFIPDEEMDVEQ